MEGRTPELPRYSAWGALWWWPPGVRLAEEQLPGPCLLPLSAPLSVIPSSSNAHDLFLGFTSAKAELKLTSLREPFAIKAAQL